MPYKSDEIPINNPQLDKRVKLTEEDKQSIRDEYAAGNTSTRALAEKYKVSRRSIQFALYPERYEKAREQFAERQKDGRYYDKDKHAEYMKKHRKYKNELYKQGLLEKEEE